MTEPELVDAQETFEKLRAGALLLVCAYDNEEKFKALHLQGAISLNELRSRLDSLSKDQEIVFYCA
jgi:rhodanese-related sulfurtransferase